jgi:hypothetical protein
MNLEEAKELLEDTEKEEVLNDDLGDIEVYWYFQGYTQCEVVAEGYFDRAYAWVVVYDADEVGYEFKILDAHELRKCGTDINTPVH